MAGTSPAPRRADCASACGCPVTSGTATFFEATATDNVTVSPFPTFVPAAGCCEITTPGGFVDGVFAIADFNPAVFSFCTASELWRPVTAGTATFAGPLETSSVTALPTSATVPAGGSVPITRPFAIEALG